MPCSAQLWGRQVMVLNLCIVHPIQNSLVCSSFLLKFHQLCLALITILQISIPHELKMHFFIAVFEKKIEAGVLSWWERIEQTVHMSWSVWYREGCCQNQDPSLGIKKVSGSSHPQSVRVFGQEEGTCKGCITDWEECNSGHIFPVRESQGVTCPTLSSQVQEREHRKLEG